MVKIVSLNNSEEEEKDEDIDGLTVISSTDDSSNEFTVNKRKTQPYSSKRSKTLLRFRRYSEILLFSCCCCFCCFLLFFIPLGLYFSYSIGFRNFVPLLDIENIYLQGVFLSSLNKAKEDISYLSSIINVNDEDYYYNTNKTEFSNHISNHLLKLMENRMNNGYFKIRYLNETGFEIIRIDKEDTTGEIVVSNPDSLQNKFNRDYTKEHISGICQNEACVSKYNLNMENHKISIPLKPTIRVYKSLFTTNYTRIGFLIISIEFSNQILDALENINILSSSDYDFHDFPFFIINNEGNYMYNSKDHSKEWERDFGKEFSFPEEYSEYYYNLFLSKSDISQLPLGSYTYRFVHLDTQKERIYFATGVAMFKSVVSGSWLFFFIFFGVLVVFVFFNCYFYSCQFLSSRALYVSNKNQKILEQQKNKTRKLIFTLVPKQLAIRLLNGEKTIVGRADRVSILFVDVKGFTSFTQIVSPLAMLNILQWIFWVIDEVEEEYKIYKIKTIGDCYMGCRGLPCVETDSEDEENYKVSDVLFGCLEMLRSLKTKCSEDGFGYKKELESLDYRIGLALGSCVFGIIERKSSTFDCWGDCINFASRLECSCLPDHVHFSHDFYVELIKERNVANIFQIQEVLSEIKGYDEKQVTFICSGYVLHRKKSSNLHLDELFEINEVTEGDLSYVCTDNNNNMEKVEKEEEEDSFDSSEE